MPECIFCRIAAGEVPSTKVHEDGVCLAFMDIGPLAPGHVLVVPKAHYEMIWDVPEAQAAHLGAQVAALAAAVKDAAGAEGVNVLQNNGRVSGQEVMHVHFHLIPRRAGDGLGYRWPAKPADPEVLEAQAEAIRKRLKA